MRKKVIILKQQINPFKMSNT